jgi:hypothetical protein
VYDLGGVSAPVFEGQAYLGGELLVGREVVVGLFVVRDRSVDQGPDVIAVDPVLGELVDEHVAVQESHRDGVGDVQNVFASRVQALPASVYELLLLAALDGTGDLRLIRVLAADRGEDARGQGVLCSAERAGLVRADEIT